MSEIWDGASWTTDPCCGSLPVSAACAETGTAPASTAATVASSSRSDALSRFDDGAPPPAAHLATPDRREPSDRLVALDRRGPSNRLAAWGRRGPSDRPAVWDRRGPSERLAVLNRRASPDGLGRLHGRNPFKGLNGVPSLSDRSSAGTSPTSRASRP
ncbi:hypothetical protein GCM10027075_43910 [Streptomyces heilongjiangensis]